MSQAAETAVQRAVSIQYYFGFYRSASLAIELSPRTLFHDHFRSWNLEGMCPVAFKVITCIDWRRWLKRICRWLFHLLFTRPMTASNGELEATWTYRLRWTKTRPCPKNTERSATSQLQDEGSCVCWAKATLLHPGDHPELACGLHQGLRRLPSRGNWALPSWLQVLDANVFCWRVEP